MKNIRFLMMKIISKDLKTLHWFNDIDSINLNKLDVKTQNNKTFYGFNFTLGGIVSITAGGTD